LPETERLVSLTDAARTVKGGFLRLERRYFTVRNIATGQFLKLHTECVFGGNKMVKDLVCGMEINEKAAGYSMIYEGEMFYFCSEGCRAEFRRHPQEYLKPPASCCNKRSEEKSDV
jgi:YHS domain-containing protein